MKIADEDGNAAAAGRDRRGLAQGPDDHEGLPQPARRDRRSALTADGYFKTGDLGKLDADGFLYITGRKKDMIIVAGEKAYPREIEDVLMRHPAVAEAAVVGKKDPSRGEVVVAFVDRQGRPARQAGRAARVLPRSRGWRSGRCPREVNVVPDFPRSPTGKVLKRELAATLPA